MLGELVPCSGGESIPLHGNNLTVGRRTENDVCIPLKSVSGQHCRLQFTDGKWHVFDLKSRNGVKIDGNRCDSGVVDPNSILGLGRAEFKLVYSAESGEPQPVPSDETSDSEPDTFWNELMMLEGVPSPGSLSSQIATNDLGMLVPCGGGDPIKLFRKSLLVGRRNRCDITLDFGTISGKHCRLEFRDDFWHIEDLGSRNGVKIEGDRVDSGWLLPGTIVSIAKQRFEIRYDTPAGAKPPVHDPFEKGLLEKAGLKQAPASRPKTRTNLHAHASNSLKGVPSMLTVLVVDDALADRVLMSGLLTKALNCDVLEADNGRSALSVVETGHPDVVLTDMNMPEMNGLELVAAMKEEHPRTPVILMTAQGSEEIAAKAPPAGGGELRTESEVRRRLAETVIRVLARTVDDKIDPQILHYLDTGELTFSIRNDLRAIESLVGFLQQTLRCLPLESETERLRVGVAVEAGLLNAVLARESRTQTQSNY